MWKNNLQLALRDLWQGLLQFRVWSLLAWQEVRQRYRRSMLGPFWLTISTGVMIAAMGPLYGRLRAGRCFVLMAISLVLWQLLVSLTTEACRRSSRASHTSRT
jgi:ABC-type polysaccharide/polyol phosphate export permease